MNAVEIIREIEALSPDEQDEVVRFAWRIGLRRQLAPDELGRLAVRLAETSDAGEAAVLREEIVQGFYGGGKDA